MNARRMFRLYGIEVRSEFLRLLRTPIYAFSTLGLPLMFYAFFGLALNREAAGGLPPMARYLLASYGAFGVMAASLFGFGVRLAIDRGLGWLEVKRASPMPPPAYFTAKTVVCLCFSAILVALMFTMGVVFGGVRMAASQLLLLGASLVLGALPFCALGLAIGYFTTADSSPAVVNMLYLPMSFCSGLWIPLPFLPHAGAKYNWG
jgi:ABC-2 type transport system permease protein